MLGPHRTPDGISQTRLKTSGQKSGERILLRHGDEPNAALGKRTCTIKVVLASIETYHTCPTLISYDLQVNAREP